MDHPAAGSPGSSGAGPPAAEAAPRVARAAGPGVLLALLGSSSLALGLVGTLALFVLAGSLLPQEGALGTPAVEAWRAAHPLSGPALGRLGLYHVFRTPAFLAVVALLALNTLTCTALRFVREGGLAGIRAGGTARRTGFYVLHAGLVLLMAGGFWSFAAELDGLVFLTEGQVFREAHDDAFPDLVGPAAPDCPSCGLKRGAHTAYRSLHEAPLRPHDHRGFEVRLDAVDVELVDGRHRVDVASRVSVLEAGKVVREGISRFNEPFEHRGFAFVQVQTGYAPRIWIRRKGAPEPMGAAFVTLTTDEGPGLRRFHDVLPLAFLPHTTVATLLPSFERRGGEARCTGEDLARPLLVIEMLDAGEVPVARGEAEQGEWTAVGDFEFRFTDVRRWSSFRVVDDAGYGTAWAALWLCVAGMVLRYAPDLSSWPGSRDGRREPGAEGEVG